MKKLIINIGRAILNTVYGVMKIGPVKDRVVFISRQSNTPTPDIAMIMSELDTRNIENVALCKMMGKGKMEAIKYCFHMLTQMKYMATSKVVVLDTYCIAVSLLNHRDGLKVIQMWHALGAMKKFGLSILDMPEGRSSETSRLMRMHKGYTHVFTSSEKSRPAFAEAFGYKPEQLTIMSLPRVDVIMDKDREQRLRNEICQVYSELTNGKINVLYSPTHRMDEDMNQAVINLIDAIDREKFNIIIKVHPLTKISIEPQEGVIRDSKYDSVDMLAVSDYVITDYSAMTYEIALKGLPMLFYAYDKDEYLKGRSFYLDYDHDMPGPIFTDAKSVAEALIDGNKDEYKAKAKAFADLYIEKQQNCTSEIVDFIEELMK